MANSRSQLQLLLNKIEAIVKSDTHNFLIYEYIYDDKIKNSAKDALIAEIKRAAKSKKDPSKKCYSLDEMVLFSRSGLFIWYAQQLSLFLSNKDDSLEPKITDFIFQLNKSLISASNHISTHHKYADREVLMNIINEFKSVIEIGPLAVNAKLSDAGQLFEKPNKQLNGSNSSHSQPALSSGQLIEKSTQPSRFVQ
jgi:hypothetical protein